MEVPAPVPEPAKACFSKNEPVLFLTEALALVVPSRTPLAVIPDDDVDCDFIFIEFYLSLSKLLANLS